MQVTCTPVPILPGTGLIVDPAVAKRAADLRAQAAAIHPRVLAIDTQADAPPDFGTAACPLLKAKLLRQRSDVTGTGSGASQGGRRI